MSENFWRKHTLFFYLVSGAWLYEQRAEQRRRFKAVLCAKPKTYAQIKEERKRCDREGTSFNPAEIQNIEEDEEQPESPALDGFFLVSVLEHVYYKWSNKSYKEKTSNFI